MHDDANLVNRPSLAKRFFHHLLHMPAWHQYVLIGAMGIAIIGAVGRIRQFTTPATSAPPTGTMASPHSSFGADGAPDRPEVSGTAPQPWYLSPRFLSTGGSVLGGFLVGWAMRVFVKTTVLIGLAVGAVFSGLSYFRVMNVDLTSVHQQYDTGMSWLTDQASRMKDIAIAHIPVHLGGLFGMFLGFRRPRTG